MHNNLPYKFQIHTLKLKQLFQDTKFNHHSKFLPIKTYLEKIPTSAFPHHIFKPEHHIQNHSDRSSQIKFKHLKITTLSKSNLANKLTALALNLAKNNKQRHEVIQDFMLTNDTTTLATEVPIYFTKDDLLYFKSKGFTINPQDYQTPVTGHIDILQIRNNLIHILDYKPDADKEKPIQQLTIYALAIASRTKLDLKSFKCAWFDENNYYEFFPLHVVYKKK
jgi:ATP-dependent exoDNAse (exonuclease V) beta subunit